MTPQEKAKELIKKFKAVEIFGACSEEPEVDAKQCALICVEEIIEAINNVEADSESYWLEVKAEIEKL